MPLRLQRVRSLRSLGDGGKRRKTPNKTSSGSGMKIAPFRRTKSREYNTGTSSSKKNRRQSELNILGTEFMVSTEYTLKMISDAQKNKAVTKLELEDLVLKDGIKESTQIHDAVKQLLQNDGKREWKYIKFLDQIEVRGEEDGDEDSEYYCSLLRQYGRAKELLWSQIEKHSRNKPVLFQVKLVFHEGTELTPAKQLLEALRELAVVKIDFGGALFNTSAENISTQLALQFNNNHNNNKYCLDEIVMLTLTWNRSKAYPTWTDATLKDCVKKLGARGMGMPLGDTSSSLSGSSSTSNNNNDYWDGESEAVGGQSSPKRRKGKTSSRDSTTKSIHRKSSRRSSPRRDASSSRSKSPIPSSRSSSTGVGSRGENKHPVAQSTTKQYSPPPSPKETVKPHSPPPKPKQTVSPSPPITPSKETVSPTTTLYPPSSPSTSPSPSSPSCSSPYKDMKVSALRILCKARGINTTTMLEKQEMIDALSC